MAGWRLKRDIPEWHEIMTYTATLRDGTVITAQTEDCDGDVEYWWVKEDGVLVAHGESSFGPDEEDARTSAERVICLGATPQQRQAAALEAEKQRELQKWSEDWRSGFTE